MAKRRRSKDPATRNITPIKLAEGWGYWVRLQRGGKKAQKFCHSLDAARLVRDEWLRAGLPPEGPPDGPSGSPTPPPRGPRETVRDGLRDYAAWLEQQGKPGAARVRYLTRALEREQPDFLELPLDYVTLDVLWAYRRAREVAGKEGGTVSRDLGILRAMLRYADHPVKFPKDLFPSENHLELPEVDAELLKKLQRLFLAMAEPFRSMARLALLTTMRQENILTLRREMFHLRTGSLLLPHTKSNRPLRIPLSGEVLEIVQANLQDGQEWLFPNPQGRPWHRVHLSRVFRIAGKRVGLPLRFHDLRHIGATLLLNRGVHTRVLMQLGGWTSERMLARYAVATDESLRAAVETLAQAVNGVAARAR
jgi:integrase